MGRLKTNRTDILYARVKPSNKKKILRYVEGLKKANRKGASVSVVVDRLIEKYVYGKK